MSRSEVPQRKPASSPAQESQDLSLDGLPKLQALMQGPDGPALLNELRQLLAREPRRARRFRRSLFARLQIQADEPPEVAVVRDLSESGVRLQLGTASRLDVMQARNVILEMRLPGTAFVRCEAKLVRVVAHHDKGVDLAFSFIKDAGHEQGLADLLERLAMDAEQT
jgi:hypothetical protein